MDDKQAKRLSPLSKLPAPQVVPAARRRWKTLLLSGAGHSSSASCATHINPLTSSLSFRDFKRYWWIPIIFFLPNFCRVTRCPLPDACVVVVVSTCAKVASRILLTSPLLFSLSSFSSGWDSCILQRGRQDFPCSSAWKLLK